MRRTQILLVLAALALAGCSDDGGGETPAATTEAAVADFGLQPVLAVTQDESCPADALADADGLCYELGPVAVDASGVESARAVLDVTGESWLVAPVLRAGDPGVDGFNAITQDCFDHKPTCPTGQLAIVYEDEVISAPTIQQAEYGRDRIQINGDFTQAEAEALAEALSP
jgi:preprotein translocase subunit SecD